MQWLSQYGGAIALVSGIWTWRILRAMKARREKKAVIAEQSDCSTPHVPLTRNAARSS